MNKLITSAKALGITLTNANEGTELFTCWADRVQSAQMAFDRGDMETCQDMIDEANRYAI
jgi:hypothetical protein